MVWTQSSCTQGGPWHLAPAVAKLQAAEERHPQLRSAPGPWVRDLLACFKSNWCFDLVRDCKQPRCGFSKMVTLGDPGRSTEETPISFNCDITYPSKGAIALIIGTCCSFRTWFTTTVQQEQFFVRTQVFHRFVVKRNTLQPIEGAISFRCLIQVKKVTEPTKAP